MKKTYEEPQLNVMTFETEDIVLASFEGAFGDNETQIIP